MTYKPRALNRCHSIDDLRQLASHRLPSPIFDFLEGAAETETSATNNVEAFDETQLIPDGLVDVARVDTSVRLLGQDLQWPVICAPTGISRMYHPAGELAVARAAAGAGTLYGLSTAASCTLEDVAHAAAGPKMFQFYVFRDRSLSRELMARCRAAKYSALCLTIDMAVRGNRERELRTGVAMPLRLSAGLLASFLASPRWLSGLLLSRAIAMPNFSQRTGSNSIVEHSRFFSAELDPSVTWSDAAQMISEWGGPFAIKGVMSVGDALRARDIGATAIVVSNHGGRQLDGVAAPIEALPAIADAVGKDLEIILEGGIRRGVHVVKALALGAKAVSIGRPYLYGLAAGGEAGVHRALDLLKSELVRTMQLCGRVNLASIDRSLVRHRWSRAGRR